MRVERRAADQPLLGREGAHAVRVHPRDQLLHLGHHLGTDPVAGEKEIHCGHAAFLRVLFRHGRTCSGHPDQEGAVRPAGCPAQGRA